MKTDDGYWSSTETATTGVYYNLWGNDCGSIASGDEHPKYVRPCFTISCKEITYIDHSVSGEAAQRVSTLTSVLSATVVPCTHGNYTFAGTPNPMVTCHYCGIAAFEDAGEHNTETIAALSSQADPVNVILSGRTLYKDGNWNTLCLPFAVSDFTGTPLEGATVKTLESSSFAGGTLTMNFTEDANNLSAIQAGKPYIVKWTKSE